MRLIPELGRNVTWRTLTRINKKRRGDRRGGEGCLLFQAAWLKPLGQQNE